MLACFTGQKLFKYMLSFKSLVSIWFYFMFLKQVSYYAHKGCIYLIKNTVKKYVNVEKSYAT